MGYTLLYMQRETTYQQALRHFDIDVPLADIEKEFHLTDKLFMRKYPGFFLEPREVFMPAYLGIMNYRLGISVNVCQLDVYWETLKAGMDDYWLPYDGAAKVLAALKQQSIGLGVISNWDCTARDILAAANLSDYFDPIIISCEVGCSKPDPAIFNLAIQRAGVSARDCIYIGDNYYDDATGSRKVGMPALIINRFGKLGVEEIRDCPIISDISEIPKYLT
jgi:putative hydrolase of the HAD superfamily